MPSPPLTITQEKEDDEQAKEEEKVVVLLRPLDATYHKAFTDRSKRTRKRHAAAPPTKKVFLALAYPHTERLLSDYESYLLASENKPHPHEVGRCVGACHSPISACIARHRLQVVPCSCAVASFVVCNQQIVERLSKFLFFCTDGNGLTSRDAYSVYTNERFRLDWYVHRLQQSLAPSPPPSFILVA